LPNLYYRTGAFEPFDPRKGGSGGDEAERLRFQEPGSIRFDNTRMLRATESMLA
jgi:hypothetical protein